MRSVYTAEIEISGLNPSAGDTILYLESPADMVLEILSASLTNYSVDTAEQLEAGLFHVDTKGSPVEPQLLQQNTNWVTWQAPRLLMVVLRRVWM